VSTPIRGSARGPRGHGDAAPEGSHDRRWKQGPWHRPPCPPSKPQATCHSATSCFRRIAPRTRGFRDTRGVRVPGAYRVA
jgi:hypothetical protein